MQVTSKQVKKWALLEPRNSPPRLASITLIDRVVSPQADLSWIFEERRLPTDPMALDYETVGDCVALRDQAGGHVVGMGLSDSRGSVYIDFRDSHPDTHLYLISELYKRQIPLVGHNLFFDAAWPMRDFVLQDGYVVRRDRFDDTQHYKDGAWLNWILCTYAAYKCSATEGFIGQEWGLKAAQRDMLHWAETNERELDLWLINGGHFKSTATKEKAGYYFFPEWRNKKGQLLEGGRWVSPDKSKMGLAPADILGHYCALDADATYLLYTNILKPALRRFRALNAYLGPEIYLPYIRAHIEQKLKGMHVDLKQLHAYQAQLAQRREEQERAVLNRREARPHITAFNEDIIYEHQQKEPAKYKKQKPLSKEPPRFTKRGAESKNWLKWAERRDNPPEPELSLVWANWNAKFELLKRTNHFNLASDEQLAWLLYERILGNAWEFVPDDFEPRIALEWDGRRVEVALTKGYKKAQEKGDWVNPADYLPTDDKALQQFGALGAALNAFKETCKLQGFCEALDALTRRDVPAPGTDEPLGESGFSGENVNRGSYGPLFRVPGTLTGRLAGGGGQSNAALNIQAVPKDTGFLSCLIPRPGHVFIDVDHSSLEQVVMCELTRDAGLWHIFGPNAQENDIYLFTGAQLPIIGPRIRNAGYDPFNPSVESIARAKKECKRERDIAKVLVLSSSYGAGARKIWRTLQQKGVDVTLDQSREMHAGYWRTYQGVKDYEKELLRQYENNNGWILNGCGRPIGVDHKKTKDIVNRSVQSAGHDCHILYMLIVEELLTINDIKFNWIIADWHDATTVEVSEKESDRVREIMQVQAYAKLNRIISGEIALKGEAKVVRSLAESKCS